ncbi:MAG: hypothetical protein BYD32DRAFT_430245 [Podila humilis]|nr:MAG: hypothetical protein BYD32DRAFT_430245 [Podila humilis]
MAFPQGSDPVCQRFESTDGTSLDTLPTLICAETGERYVMWSSIRDICEDVDYLETWRRKVVLFMIDNDGELRHPFRVPYDSSEWYQVNRSDYRDHQIQGGYSDVIPRGWSTYVASREEICKELNDRLSSSYRKETRRSFQQIVVNARYYHSTFVQEMAKVRNAADKSLVDQMDQVVIHIRHFQEQIARWEYKSNCYDLFNSLRNRRDFLISSFFVVLPSENDSWDDSDPLTHQFRIYFLCSSWDKPHFLNHPGFILKRPQEFLRIYGDHALRVLLMIKYGGSSKKGCLYIVPPLHTLTILQGCDTAITGRQLSMDSIVILVDKAITYLKDLSPPKLMNVPMDYNRSAAIKSYLDIQDGDRAEASLYRRIDSEQHVRWYCENHVVKHVTKDSKKRMKAFVRSRGVCMDFQLSTLRVQLGSETTADQLVSLLEENRDVFDNSISVRGELTRATLEMLCRAIGGTRMTDVELDGFIIGNRSQDHVQHRISSFVDLALKSSIGCVTLLNYPRPRQHSVYMAGCLLHSKLLPVRYSYDWIDLRSGLEQFRNAVTILNNMSECVAPARKLLSALATHGLKDVAEVTIYREQALDEQPWIGTFALLEGILIGLGSSDLSGPKTWATSRSLRSLTQYIMDLDSIEGLNHIVQSNTRLQELSISIRGRDMLSQVEPITLLCRNHPRPFTFTLFERTLDERDRVVGQVAIVDSVTVGTESSFEIELQEAEQHAHSVQGQTQDATMNLECLRWDCDYLDFHFSDLYASFLNSATEHHPQVLTSLTLNIFALSESGLVCIQRVLAQSDLEHLCIVCVPLLDILRQSIADVLLSVRTNTLKHLVLSGENIDGWLKIWSLDDMPRLLRLDIYGSGLNTQEISHAGVMTLFRLIHSSALVELNLKNIRLQEQRDWELIVDGTDQWMLETFGLCSTTSNQFMSTPDAVDSLFSTLQAQTRERVGIMITISCFNLDIVSISKDDRVRVQNILRRSTLEHLRVRCASFDHSLFNSFTQIMGSVPWSTLTSLVLSGEDIGAWIGLSGDVLAPRLRRLIIQGTKCDTQQLSHLSALRVQRLIHECSLWELKFEKIQLQDGSDWYRILERTMSTLRHIEMCDTTWSQFRNVKAAYDLYETYREKWVSRWDNRGFLPDSEDEHMEAVLVEEDPDSKDYISIVGLVHKARGTFRTLRRKWTPKLL